MQAIIILIVDSLVLCVASSDGCQRGVLFLHCCACWHQSGSWNFCYHNCYNCNDFRYARVLIILFRGRKQPRILLAIWLIRVFLRTLFYSDYATNTARYREQGGGSSCNFFPWWILSCGSFSSPLSMERLITLSIFVTDQLELLT